MTFQNQTLFLGLFLVVFLALIVPLAGCDTVKGLLKKAEPDAAEAAEEPAAKGTKNWSEYLDVRKAVDRLG